MVAAGAAVTSAACSGTATGTPCSLMATSIAFQDGCQMLQRNKIHWLYSSATRTRNHAIFLFFSQVSNVVLVMISAKTLLGG
jgi:hypothetical protein